MEKAEKAFKGKCPKDADATRACAMPLCKHPPLLCANSDCGCKALHSNCLTITSLDDIYQRMVIKSKSHNPLFE